MLFIEQGLKGNEQYQCKVAGEKDIHSTLLPVGENVGSVPALLDILDEQGGFSSGTLLKPPRSRGNIFKIFARFILHPH